jgi:uncharacterized protein
VQPPQLPAIFVGMVEQRGPDVRLHVRVQPRASRSGVAGEHAGALKIRLAAPPVDGAANDELVRFLSRTLRIAASRVRVVSGAASRSKVVEITDADAAVVTRALLT